MNEVDVLIIGAGPSGLTLAVDLVKQGIDCMVLEKRSSISSNLTRAFSVHARTLELLHTRGLAKPIRERGIAVDSIPLLWGMHARFDNVPSEFREMLVIPQYEVEDVLLERYLSLGGKILYEAEFVDLKQSSDKVSVRVNHDGLEQQIAARYVVGADGHRSSVRKSIDVKFSGDCVLPSVIISDAKIQRPPTAPLTLVANKKGFVFIAPFGDGYHRVLSWDLKLHPHQDESQDFERLQSMVRSILGQDLGIHAPRWLSRFSSHERVAEKYRVGRVFLIGDAAHVHSPAGGLGMNLGIQDAINLGWKLGSVIQNNAPERLLDTYELEMRPLGLQAVKESGQLIREATGRRGPTAALKDALLCGVEKISPMKNFVENKLGRTISGTNYTMRTLKSQKLRSASGTFAHDLMHNDEVIEGLRSHKHVLVIPNNSQLDSRPLDGKNYIQVNLKHALWGNQPRLLRPDGYIDVWKP
ncbi:FAD-dependent monooxygenase [Glutamicibacter endophyticus]|uniref:FAD-dependent monooxygenase n=1 Tax=Glutamicibacter endophyticus TaxID=1522174 RepID=UPI003AF16814